jgi:O-methyltransferase
VLDANLASLGVECLSSLLDELTRVKAREVAGDFTEFGVALGGSGICIAFQLDGIRRFCGFDGFGMIPPPTEADGATAIAPYESTVPGRSHDIGGDPYPGNVEDLYGSVMANFARFWLRIDQRTLNLVPGPFESTLPRQIHFPIAFAHINCDWDEHVKYCLKFVHERLSRFGVVIVEDYNGWPACRNAVDQFCSTRDDVLLVRPSPHAVLLKLAA